MWKTMRPKRVDRSGTITSLVNQQMKIAKDYDAQKKYNSWWKLSPSEQKIWDRNNKTLKDLGVTRTDLHNEYRRRELKSRSKK